MNDFAPRRKLPDRLLATCCLLLMMAGCATPSPFSISRDTSDLKAVRDDVVALARQHDTGRVLVVFDLDNTLLAMEQGLGSDQWYEWQKQLAREAPCDPRAVADRLAVQGAMYFASAMRATQPDAADLVRDLQQYGFPVIALTSRGPDFRLQTFRELRRNGFDLRRTALEPAAGWPEDFQPRRGTRPVRYEDGVFLTAGQHKGEMLLELLDRTGSPLPRTIVMADDKRANLEAVSETFVPRGVAVRAWRYSGEDATVAAFDAAAAHGLWQQLEPALRRIQETLGADNFQLPAAAHPACGTDDGSVIRFATFNAAMGLAREGELARRLEAGTDPDLRKLSEIIQRVRPDVLLLNEIDYQPHVDAGRLLQENYLSRGQSGQSSIEYPYRFSSPVNTGVPSGLDIDGNGRTGDPGDAWGFGHFPGQYGMLILSRFPLDEAAVRSFRNLSWSDMPGALRPVYPDGSHFHDDNTWSRLRLSSKSHWDVPVHVNGATIHLLASHPTPPVFDGPEDRNGRRNHDEIRLWADYLNPDRASYLVDDDGRRGGLGEDALFVIAGDLNSDPQDGDSSHAIRQLLRHERVNNGCTPRAEGGTEASRRQGGANREHQSDPAQDTADFSDSRIGNLRADYVLPSRRLEVLDCGIFWPLAGEPGFEVSGFSDHHLVWVDLRVPTDPD